MMQKRDQHNSEASFVNSCTFNKQVQDSFLRNQKQWKNDIKAWWPKKSLDLTWQIEPAINIIFYCMMLFFFPSLLL